MTAEREQYDDKPCLTLPQPSSSASDNYTYVLYDNVESTYFPSTLAEGTLCWVLKSKGATKNTDNNDAKSHSQSSSRAELFLRARVVKQVDDDRFLVRYPKGSEYRVRRSNLIPVLEETWNLVIVAPETPEYRRACVVHTRVGESFLEIGCDFGPTVDRVRKALTEVGAVPRVAGEPIDSDAAVVSPKRVFCLGVDKSPESIEIAVSKYPKCTFSLEDALTDDGTVKLRSLCNEKLVGGHPSVVAVDINGNREIPAVLQCVENIMNPGNDVVLGEDWRLPRLIIVKSRLLYAEIKKQRKEI